jgi:hypothetical protein
VITISPIIIQKMMEEGGPPVDQQKTVGEF